jgi:ribonuclease VapC
MVVDSSAIIAILLNEPGAERFNRAVAMASVRMISAGNLLEAGIVMDTRRRENGVHELDFWLFRSAIEIVPVDATQVAIARRAWHRYGKGRHPAALNFGDCFAYALAIARNEALLFKGNDFSKTDVQTVKI